MLFQKYASPLILLDQMIRCGRFGEFVNEFVKIHNDDLRDKTLWELWLHKVFDKTYADFLESANQCAVEPNHVSQADLENTVKESMEIMKGFCPS